MRTSRFWAVAQAAAASKRKAERSRAIGRHCDTGDGGPSYLLRERTIGVEGLVGDFLELVELSVQDLLDVVVEVSGHEEELARTGAPHREQVGIFEEDVRRVGIVGSPDHRRRA